MTEHLIKACFPTAARRDRRPIDENRVDGIGEATDGVGAKQPEAMALPLDRSKIDLDASRATEACQARLGISSELGGGFDGKDGSLGQIATQA